MATARQKPKTQNQERIMTMQEILNTATQEELRMLREKMDGAQPREKLGKKILRVGTPILGTAALAAAVTYAMTRGQRRAIKAIDQKLDHLLAGADEDNVVPMGKTGTR